MKLYTRRRLVNRLALVLSSVAAASGLIWLIAILYTLLAEGGAALSLDIVASSTPPPGSPGGLLNAIFGSLVMVATGTLAGVPVGVFAATYMAEYGKGTKLTTVVRFLNDILVSAPSIVIGLFIYELVVVPMGHFSAWAGCAALAVLVIPVVVRTTEDMLNLVPASLREAAASLGTPKWRVTTAICYRAARSGMITGALLGVARISGETAPLLFTALNNQFWSANLNAPMASLPVVIFQFALSPYDEWQRLAWTGALIIAVGVLSLNIVARAVSGPAWKS